jgi:hypothetical protein
MEGGPQRVTHVRFQFTQPDDYAIVELLWEEAPRTCGALVTQFPCEVMSCHARHSGGEALFITPEVVAEVGDENASLDYAAGDVLFGFEPVGICQHAAEACSEVAWIYHGAAMPRRWVSVDGDPTNQRGPWQTVDVPLNKWGRVVEESGFYARCGRMPRSGEQFMSVCDFVADGSNAVK